MNRLAEIGKALRCLKRPVKTITKQSGQNKIKSLIILVGVNRHIDKNVNVKFGI